MLTALFHSFKSGLKNPTFWFGVFMIIYSGYKLSDDWEHQNIRGDSRGYYAYLPAFFTYEDPSFKSSVEVEKTYLVTQNEPDYLVLSGRQVHNKYFPGVAMLQAPFYSMASVTAIITGHPADGYSRIYQAFFRLGQTFFAILGLILFHALLVRLFPKNRLLIQWIVPAIYLATPLFHYSVNSLSYSHAYSIFLFAAFALLVIKTRNDVSKWNFFWLGVVLGMIFLVRPTNAIIVLIVPFLLGNRETLIAFFNQLFVNKGRKFLFGALGFSLMILHLLLIWKWQSGKWILSSYGSDEGFNFLDPQLIASLFSFRIGLFVHTPILILTIVAVVFYFKKEQFKFFWWSLYFLVNAWVISAWWCWDYESTFGNRPYTEHLVFLLLPLISLLIHKKRIVVGLICLFTVVGFLRLNAYNTGMMTNQRFTSENYFSSMAVWNDQNFDRWSYTKSCEPYGELINEYKLSRRKEEITIGKNDVFLFPCEIQLPKQRATGRHYYRISLDKKVFEVPFEGINVVIDGKDEHLGTVYYKAIPLTNDRFEGLNSWKHLEIEGIIPDNLHQLDAIKVYLWNPSKMEMKVRDLKITIEEYRS